MRRGNPPANRYTITLGEYVLEVNVQVRKGSAEDAMDGLEGFGPDKNRVGVRETIGLAVLVEHLIDRRFTFLVPYQLEPTLQEKFVRLRHSCPPNVGRSLEHFYGTGQGFVGKSDLGLTSKLRIGGDDFP